MGCSSLRTNRRGTAAYSASIPDHPNRLTFALSSLDISSFASLIGTVPRKFLAIVSCAVYNSRRFGDPEVGRRGAWFPGPLWSGEPESKECSNVQHSDGTGRDGTAGHGRPERGRHAGGHTDDSVGSHQSHHGAARHAEGRAVYGWFEDHLFLRRQDGVQHGAESVYHAGRRHVQRLLHDERHGGLLLQLHRGHVQVRDDQRRRLRDLHERRRQVLRDDSSLLRLRRLHAEGRLHLLCADEQHPGLLRLLLSGLVSRLDVLPGCQKNSRSLVGFGSFFVFRV